jgi:hypothetical protein
MEMFQASQLFHEILHLEREGGDEGRLDMRCGFRSLSIRPLLWICTACQ